MISRKEARAWHLLLEEQQKSGVKAVRENAAKWQSTIGALIGAFGTAAVIRGPGTYKDLGAPDWLNVLLLVLTVLAAACGFLAVLLSAVAAQGVPKVQNFWTSINLKAATENDAKTALGWLGLGRQLTFAAAGIAFVTWILVLLLSITAPRVQRVLVKLSDSSYQCAVLENSTRIQLRIGDASPVPMPPGATIDRTVDVCP